MSREELEKLYERLSVNLTVSFVIHDDRVSISFDDAIEILNLVTEKIKEKDDGN